MLCGPICKKERNKRADALKGCGERCLKAEDPHYNFIMLAAQTLSLL
jgi:hypothetical protein